MELVFSIGGLPELGDRLDHVATVVSGPIAREALEAGGEIIAEQAKVLRQSGIGVRGKRLDFGERGRQFAAPSGRIVGRRLHPAFLDRG